MLLLCLPDLTGATALATLKPCVWCCSAQFALRSYLYLLLHATVAAPAAVWFGSGAGGSSIHASLQACMCV